MSLRNIYHCDVCPILSYLYHDSQLKTSSVVNEDQCQVGLYIEVVAISHYRSYLIWLLKYWRITSNVEILQSFVIWPIIFDDIPCNLLISGSITVNARSPLFCGSPESATNNLIMIFASKNGVIYILIAVFSQPNMTKISLLFKHSDNLSGPISKGHINPDHFHWNNWSLLQCKDDFQTTH